MTVDGEQVTLLDTGERAFVRAGPAFWRSHGAAADAIATYGTQWVRVDDDLFGFDLGDTLAPGTLTLALAPWLDEDIRSYEVEWPDAGPVTRIDGVEVRTVYTPDTTVYVTTAAPKRIVRIADDDRAASPTTRNTVAGDAGGYRRLRAPGDDAFALDLDDLTPQETTELFQEIQRRINELISSVDSLVRFSLSGNIVLAPCTTTGCQANLTIRNQVSSSSPYLQVNRPVNASVTIRMTLDGRPVRTCVQQVSMAPNGSATVTCFASYYLPPSRNPRTHQVRAVASAVARALVAADVKKLIDDTKAEWARNRVNQPDPPYVDVLPRGTKPNLNPEQLRAYRRVADLARKACRDVARGANESAQKWGDQVHEHFNDLIEAEGLNNPKLFPETGYRNGVVEPGKIRLRNGRMGWRGGTRAPDVVFGPDQLHPELFMDLKTGTRGLEPGWYRQLNRQLPPGFRNVLTIAVRC